MEANMTFPIRIVPRYRFLLRYDVRTDAMDTYYEFIMNEFIPALQSMGLYMAGVWHTAYGAYPDRQVEFIGGHSRDIPGGFTKRALGNSQSQVANAHPPL